MQKLSENSGKPTADQRDKFIEAARELGCDEDEGRWNEKLKKVAGHKPPPEKPDKAA